MAVLRKFARPWARTSPSFSTDFCHALDPTGMSRDGRLYTSRKRLMLSDLAANNRVKSDEPIRPEEWIKIRKELLAAQGLNIKECSVDMTIVHLCLDNGKIDRAMKYLQYLWDTNGEMNLSSMISYLKLCHNIGPDATQMRCLLTMYDRIREKYTVMDELTSECCILGITQTDRWKEAIELIEELRLTSPPRKAPYSALIVAAFNNNDPKIGWKYLHEIIVRMNPDTKVYTAYLNYCTRNFDGDRLTEEITKIFQLWGDRDIRPYVDVIDQFEKVITDNGWSSVRTSIKKLGKCSNCGHNLSSLKITSEQFTKLTKAVRDQVLIRKDVYQNTTPKELNEFLKFLRSTKPYDVVIDGLNVSFGAQGKSRPDGMVLTDVVKLCVQMGKTVLVLGRKHMVKWRKLDIPYIKAHGNIFLAENSSSDDAFLLYATLMRGPDTQFISKDLMRQHNYRLGDSELTKTFRYWQMAHRLHQVAVQGNQGTREVHLCLPPTYLPVAQRDDSGWHVPYTTEPITHLATNYKPPETWICFRKTRSNPRTKSNCRNSQ